MFMLTNQMVLLRKFISNEAGAAAQDSRDSYLFVVLGILLILACIYLIASQLIMHVDDQFIRHLLY
jgi:hypothetical protein